jgi:hydrogenase maturation protease
MQGANPAHAVSILDAGTDGFAVMFAARGCEALIVVDACRTGAEPGAVFELPADVVAREHEPSLNLHDFRWDHVVAAGRRLFGAAFPNDVWVFLIDARSLALGFELSPEVEAASALVASRIEQRVCARRRAVMTISMTPLGVCKPSL